MGGRRKRCSACSQLRKACEPNCVFAPFFPASKSESDANFKTVHKIYGSENIRNVLIGIADEADKVTFMDSLLWEARHREDHPIRGSKGVYDDLEHNMQSRIHTLKAEVMRLRQLQEQNPMLASGSRTIRNTYYPNLNDSEWNTFVESLVWEWSNRQRNPILGSKGCVEELLIKIHKLEAELESQRQPQQNQMSGNRSSPNPSAYHPQPQMTDPGTSRHHAILNFGTGQQSNPISSPSPYYGRSEPESIPEHGRRIGHSNLIGSSSDLEFFPSDTWDEYGALKESTDFNGLFSFHQPQATSDEFGMLPEFYSETPNRRLPEALQRTPEAFNQDINSTNSMSGSFTGQGRTISNSLHSGLQSPTNNRLLRISNDTLPITNFISNSITGQDQTLANSLPLGLPFPSLPGTSDDTEPVTLPAFEDDTNAANPVISHSPPLGLPFRSLPRTSDDSDFASL